MKTEDFERLKKLCDENGFSIESYSGGKTAIIGLKDEWEGVEFAQHIASGKIFKPTSIRTFIIDLNEEIGFKKTNCKPSTEQAYIEQLKKEAFDRFGDIREGDRFECNNTKQICHIGFKDFDYYKHIDRVYAFGALIYQKGKWAKKLPQPTKVTVSDFSHFGTSVQFKMNISKWCDKKGTDIGDYLAKCLEDYLNRDAK